MRKLKSQSKAYLHYYVKQTRKQLGLTQEEMAARLSMSTRSYSDIERGKSGFSATTLLIFLSLLQDDKEILDIVHGFAKQVLDLEREEVA